MKDSMHVIFGTGPLGQAVMRALVEKGETVRMVNRTGKRPQSVPAQVEVRGGDAYEATFTRQAAEGASVVYQCAQPHYWEWTTQFIPLQEAIMAGAEAAGAKFIVGDNLYMYGEVAGPIREDTPWSATTRKGKTRSEAAQRVLQAHQDGRLQVAIGRGSDFFGPGVLDSVVGERTFLPAVQGKAAEGLGVIDLPHTYTYIDDFGKALVILGERPEALGQAWHVPNPQTVSTRRFIELIFDALGQPPKINIMTKSKLRLGGLFIPAARETVEMMYEFEKPFVVDHSKFTDAFGDIATPLEEAIQRTVAWYQEYVEQAKK